MIQHVGLEIHPADQAACVAFWAVLGWEETPVPPGVVDPGTWLQRQDCQIHLQLREEPRVPHEGHLAIVDLQLDETAARIEGAGYELLERTRHWGSRRIFTRCPAGHRVELMAAPPG